MVCTFHAKLHIKVTQTQSKCLCGITFTVTRDAENPYHEQLMCKWTQCHFTLKHSADIYLNHSLCNLIIKLSPGLEFQLGFVGIANILLCSCRCCAYNAGNSCKHFSVKYAQDRWWNVSFARVSNSSNFKPFKLNKQQKSTPLSTRVLSERQFTVHTHPKRTQIKPPLKQCTHIELSGLLHINIIHKIVEIPILASIHVKIVARNAWVTVSLCMKS